MKRHLGIRHPTRGAENKSMEKSTLATKIEICWKLARRRLMPWKAYALLDLVGHGLSHETIAAARRHVRRYRMPDILMSVMFLFLLFDTLLNIVLMQFVDIPNLEWPYWRAVEWQWSLVVWFLLFAITTLVFV